MDKETPNIKKWIVLYPVYINSKKTMAEGRRISVAKACEGPTCVEIVDYCSYFKLAFAIEIDKAYPRDFMQIGRVRVLLKREDGTPYNPDITSRKQLVLKLRRWFLDILGGLGSRRPPHPDQVLDLPNLVNMERKRDSSSLTNHSFAFDIERYQNAYAAIK